MDIFGNFSKLSGDKTKRSIYNSEKLEFSYSEIGRQAVSKIEEKAATPQVAFKIILVLFFVVLCLKLFYLQIVQGEANESLAQGNRIRPRIIEAPRGKILDSEGVWLARNKPDYVLLLYPSDLPKNSREREQLYEKIAELIESPKDEVEKLASQRGNYFLDSVILKDNLSHDQALLIEERIYGLPGIAISLRSSREYASLAGLAHLLGYTGMVSDEDIENNPDYFLSDWIGKTGLEKRYERTLRGAHGLEQVEVDSLGNVLQILVGENRLPKSGNDLTLYLDRDLQEKTAEALKTGMAQAIKLKGAVDSPPQIAGVAAVMDVKTGGILSLVSLPDYDNNLFSPKISAENYALLAADPARPLFNRAIGGTYPPGSIIKIVMAAAGLADGIITPNTSFDTPPEIKIGDYLFPDWKDHGLTDVRRAIAESNNVFFYAVGGGFDKIRGLGIERIKHYWQLFGLGEPSGLDIGGEASGLLPDPQWKKKRSGEPWYLGDTYHVSIGQGDLLVTPLQMLRITAAIANGGKLLEPRLVKRISRFDGEVLEEIGSVVKRENFISADMIKIIQQGMRLAVTEGSARNLADLPVGVAAKTGTAQFFGQETHAWFEAYAPFENPEVAIVVLVEGGGGGHEIAAPVAKEILNYYFSP